MAFITGKYASDIFIKSEIVSSEIEKKTGSTAGCKHQPAAFFM